MLLRSFVILIMQRKLLESWTTFCSKDVVYTLPSLIVVIIVKMKNVVATELNNFNRNRINNRINKRIINNSNHKRINNSNHKRILNNIILTRKELFIEDILIYV